MSGNPDLTVKDLRCFDCLKFQTNYVRDQYYILRDEKQTGPFTLLQLRNMWGNGAVTSGMYYWREGMAKWLPLSTLQFKLEEPATVRKSRTVYILLAVFFGFLGIHDFYAGYPGFGTCYLLLTIFTGWLVIPLFVMAIVLLIEIFAVTKDGRGNAFA